VEHYNNVRLNSATGYITPKDVLAGRQQEIHAERDRKLEARQTAAPASPPASRVKSEARDIR
jgi:putative transposase